MWSSLNEFSAMRLNSLSFDQCEKKDAHELSSNMTVNNFEELLQCLFATFMYLHVFVCLRVYSISVWRCKVQKFENCDSTTFGLSLNLVDFKHLARHKMLPFWFADAVRFSLFVSNCTAKTQSLVANFSATLMHTHNRRRWIFGAKIVAMLWNNSTDGQNDIQVLLTAVTIFVFCLIFRWFVFDLSNYVLIKRSFISVALTHFFFRVIVVIYFLCWLRRFLSSSTQNHPLQTFPHNTQKIFLLFFINFNLFFFCYCRPFRCDLSLSYFVFNSQCPNFVLLEFSNDFKAEIVSSLRSVRSFFLLLQKVHQSTHRYSLVFFLVSTVPLSNQHKRRTTVILHTMWVITIKGFSSTKEII